MSISFYTIILYLGILLCVKGTRRTSPVPHGSYATKVSSTVCLQAVFDGPSANLTAQLYVECQSKYGTFAQKSDELGIAKVIYFAYSVDGASRPQYQGFIERIQFGCSPVVAVGFTDMRDFLTNMIDLNLGVNFNNSIATLVHGMSCH
ncbi:hypothetical protein FOL47_005616 [Perkinsus chesapeaki]|uniref:Uncharacterized protein n=1 Tax=Perkinsus chesapeaki TaxID=330153 RepID=A0A7J6MYI3_PERCH|nr:hypothetical protein FOL47_005616 [Perkinsus chesapeaki]